MTTRRLKAMVLAAALTGGAPMAMAADLDYGPAPSDRYSSAYEDPRYRELYGAAPVYRGPPPPVPPAYVYPENEPRGYRRYSEVDRDDFRHRQGCLPRSEIKNRLINEGWRDFHDLDLRPGVALLRARRPNGDLYDLKVDRCNGEIVRADVVERGRHVPYAYDSGPRRYERPYY